MELCILPLLGLLVQDLLVPTRFGTIWKLVCSTRLKCVFVVILQRLNVDCGRPSRKWKDKQPGLSMGCRKAIQQIRASRCSSSRDFCDLTIVGDNIGVEVKQRSDGTEAQGRPDYNITPANGKWTDITYSATVSGFVNHKWWIAHQTGQLTSTDDAPI